MKNLTDILLEKLKFDKNLSKQSDNYYLISTATELKRLEDSNNYTIKILMPGRLSSVFYAISTEQLRYIVDEFHWDDIPIRLIPDNIISGNFEKNLREAIKNNKYKEFKWMDAIKAYNEM